MNTYRLLLSATLLSSMAIASGAHALCDENFGPKYEHCDNIERVDAALAVQLSCEPGNATYDWALIAM